MSDEVKMEDETSDHSMSPSTMELPPAEATFGSILPFINPPAAARPINTLNHTLNQAIDQSFDAAMNQSNTAANAQSTTQLSLATISQLIDDLRSNDLTTRQYAFQSIHQISYALGPLRTREELLPYLNEFIDDDDEILLTVAQKLKEFVPLVGGVVFAHCIFPPLESLLSCEEILVRQSAIESIIHIADQMNDQQVENYLVPIMRKLGGDLFFTAKMSCAYLFPQVYQKVINGDKQKELRGIFLRLCSDETPMVKRAACEVFGKAVDAVATTQSPQPSSQSPTQSNQSSNQSILKSELFPVYLKLVKDDQDSVRLYTVDAAINLSVHLTTSDQITKMLPVLFQLCADKSWRVRYMAALKFVNIVRAMSGKKQTETTEKTMGHMPVSDELLDAYVRLLNDDEAEVRTASTKMLGELSQCIGPSFTLRKMMGSTKILAKDPSQFVRAALASSLVTLCHTLLDPPVSQSSNAAINRDQAAALLLPLFLSLLRDSHSEVRLELIRRFDPIVNDCFSLSASADSSSDTSSLSSALLPCIRELCSDPKWRVRYEIISEMSKLACQFGCEFFDESLSEIVFSWWGDAVYSIRAAATLNLTQCVEHFGEIWAKKSILPKIMMYSSHSSYLYRVTCCSAFKGISPYLSRETIMEKIGDQSMIDVLVKLCSDPVPNVRFSACKTLEEIVDTHPIMKGDRHQDLTNMKQLLIKLQSDEDLDVKYYAKRAYEAWQ